MLLNMHIEITTLCYISECILSTSFLTGTHIYFQTHSHIQLFLSSSVTEGRVFQVWGMVYLFYLSNTSITGLDLEIFQWQMCSCTKKSFSQNQLLTIKMRRFIFQADVHSTGEYHMGLFHPLLKEAMHSEVMLVKSIKVVEKFISPSLYCEKLIIQLGQKLQLKLAVKIY